MRSIRRILVAIKDPEARSLPALHKAAQLARALGAHLELFHALTWPIYASSDQDFTELRAKDQDFALRRLQRLADRLGSRGRQGPLSVSVTAQWDSPDYEAIIRRATAIKADLIVAERYNRLHIASMLLHLNDWELLRQSPVPVLLVKRGGQYKHPVVLAAVDPMHSLDKPAQLDRVILDTGSAIAAALRGRLHSVHAYVALTGGERATQALDAESAAAIDRKQAAAVRHRYERLLNGYHIRRARRHLLNLSPRDAPSDAIQAVAATTRAAIVALGAISRSGWQRLLIGNTAEDLLDPLGCDLLVVKPPRFKARVPRRPVGAKFVAAPSLTH